MRTVVIILAVIGGLFVLTIGGCVGCVGLVLYGARQATPDHFTKAEISKMYGPQIASVGQAITSGEDFSYPARQFDEAVVAILHEVPESSGSSFTDRVDVYGRYALEVNGHFTFNGAGAQYLEVNGEPDRAFAAYTLTVKEDDYIVVLRDWKPEVESSER